MAPFLTAGPFSARNGEGRELYRDVSVELDESELVVLGGPSGSGKSTLLRQLAALDPVDDVVRSLGGEDVQPGSFPRWRSRVTLAAQDAPMLMATVGENLQFPFTQKSSENRLDEDRMSALMARVGLDEIPLDRDVKTLSGGERHRLALVRGLLWDPPVLLADEPLSGLDEELAGVCFELLRDFARRPGHAALCVLHERVFTAAADRHIALVSSTGDRSR